MKVNWKGRYSYDLEFDAKKSFAFELVLEFEEGQFRGFAVEEEFALYAEESPTVAGFIEGDFMSFNKQYPFKYGEDEGGIMAIDRTKPGHEVNYYGRYNAEKEQWEGNWEIILNMYTRWTEVTEEELISGSWIMEIVNS